MDLAILFRALDRADIAVTPEELLDALELYRLGVRVSGDERPADVPDSPHVEQQPPPESVETPPRRGIQPSPPPKADRPLKLLAVSGTELLPRQPGWPGPERGEGVPVKAPTVAALRQKLAIGRALRPLKRSVPSRHRTTLDLVGSARCSAMARRLVPATRPAPERWLDVEFVVDHSESYAVWEDTVREAKTVLENHGAFRSLRTWYLEPSGSTGVDLIEPGGGPVPANSPVPSHRRLIVVLTDAVAPFWQGAAIQEIMRCWTAHSPVVIAHLLPERLWEDSGICPMPVYFPASTLGYDSRLPFTQYGGDGNAENHIAVPMVGLNDSWMLQWSRMAVGHGESPVPGTAWLIPRRPEPDALPEWSDDEDLPETETDAPDAAWSRDAVLGFRVRASDMAFRLARYLAIGPRSLSLPVMRAIQAAMLPESDAADLAQVFLSGLLKKAANPYSQVETAEAERWFEFADDTRAQLRAGVSRADQAAFRQGMGAFLASRWDLTPAQFDAVMSSGLRELTQQLNAAPEPLAVLTAPILESIGIEHGFGGSGLGAGGSIHILKPPAFALSGHTADLPWLTWVESVLMSWGCTVQPVSWPSTNATVTDPDWQDAPHRLALVTQRSVEEAGWLAPTASDDRRAPHILWIPGTRLPESLRHGSVTVLTPGDEHASEQALHRLVVQAARSSEPDESLRVLKVTVPSRDPAQAAAERQSRFPGKPAFTHNLRPRRPYFVGRTAELAAIRDALRERPVSGVPVGVVSGPVGSGKTELAVEYAHEYGSEYDLVWMVRADDPQAMRTDLEAFTQQANRLNLTRRGSAPPWLDLPARCLLIYHLAATPADLKAVWPRSGAGHVMVTTWSARHWTGSTPAPIELGPLGREDAEEVIRLGLAISGREWDTDPLVELPEFLNEFPALPLAVVQALDTVGAIRGPSFSDLLAGTRALRALEPAGQGGLDDELPHVGLLGGTSCGKTTFAAVLQVAVEQHLRRFRTAWTLVQPSEHSLELLHEQLRALQVDRAFPEPTRHQANFSWVLRRHVERAPRRFARRSPAHHLEVRLRVCDLPGAYYSMLPTVWISDALEPIVNANGLIYLFDPEHEAGRTGALPLLQGVLSRLSDAARARGEMPGGRLPHRLAVCVAKFDRQPLIDLARSRGYLSVHPTSNEPGVSPEHASQFFSDLCRTLHPDCVEIDRTIRRMFDPRRVRYFATSAIGLYARGPGECDLDDCENRISGEDGEFRVRGKVRPLNVLEPLLWAGGASE